MRKPGSEEALNGFPGLLGSRTSWKPSALTRFYIFARWRLCVSTHLRMGTTTGEALNLLRHQTPQSEIQ